MTTYNVAIVTSDLEFGRSIANRLRKIEGVGIIPEEMSDELSAKAQLSKNSYHVTIVHNDLAMDENSLPENGRGMALLGWIHESGYQTTKALICSVESSLSIAVPPETTILRAGADFSQLLEKAVKEFVSGQSARQKSYVKVILELGDASNGQAPYYVTGEGDDYQGTTGETFAIDRGQLKRWIDRSRSIRTSPGWQSQLLNLGQDLREQLLRGDKGLWGAIQNGLGHVGNDLSRMKFCFRVSPEVHALAVEALASGEEPTPEWWMLKALIYRSFYKQRPQDRGPLYTMPKPGSPPINCLIIEADARGTVPGLERAPGDPLILDELPTMVDEAKTVEGILLQHRVGNGRVLRLNAEFVADRAFDTVLTNTLEEDWHIVHYIGHSFFDEASRKNYLFFPGMKVGSAPVKMEVSHFCGQLKNTQFLYLSSCRGSEANLILALAENGIPSAVGFRWNVVDERAAEYADQFYQHLFGKKEHCVQYAFLETRRLMHLRHPDDSIWASPMLLYRG